MSRVYTRRAEYIHTGPRRLLDDTHSLRRADSAGHERQLVNLIGLGLAMTSVVLAQARQQRAGPVVLAA